MLDKFIIIACLAINAFFSAYEMAFVTISKDEIFEISEVKKNIALKIKNFKKRPERTLSVIQIGITLVGAIAAAVGGTGAVKDLQPYFIQQFSISADVAQAISIIIIILPLTFITVVFGELVPKTIALKHPKEVLTLGTSVLALSDKLLSPIVTSLEVSTNFLLKLLRLDDTSNEDESMGQSVDIGNLAEFHQRFVKNLVELKGKKISSSMIPLNKVIYLTYGESEEEVETKISKTPHTRFPVIDGDVIVGILHKKDLSYYRNIDHVPWEGILRSAKTVRSSDHVLEAFLKMQESQNHLAVVIDNQDIPVGIITIEDILEEIVGDIHDNADLSYAAKILSNRQKINFKT